MRYGSVCSGIEAATAAWHPLGWQPAFFSEIEAAPRAVLAHHYPDVPCHGDFTTIGADEYGAIDLLVGGTPCQSFSVAGLRGGLADDRGNLALQFLKLAERTRARWVVWENVPGVLSSSGGRDFGSILGGLVQLGHGFAYRVLDAQFFGVPQRRRRVFVVGHLGDWRRAAAVLFERHSLSGNPAPRREGGQGTPGFSAGSFGGYREGVGTLRANGGDLQGDSETLAVFAATDYQSGAFEAVDQSAPLTTSADRTRAAPICFSAKDHGADASDIAPTLRAGGHSGSHANAGVMPAVAFGGDVVRTLSARHDSSPCVDRGMDVVGQGSAVRRLTPRECERLQGFPDDFTLVPYRKGMMADGPRYKMLGNSMAVPVMAWIGERIAAVEALSSERLAA